MFSMEDRRRAVDLYFTEGMTIRKVIAELGYPSEGALVKWVREDPRYTGACRRSYTLECKTNAARRALEGEPLARVARDAGCTPTSVYQWMRRYRSEGILGLMDRRNAPMPAEPMPAAGDDVEELRRQVEVLRLENAVMRETIDVLKADDPRLDPSMLTNRERTRVVDAIRGEFGLAACLKAVGLKRSTYYYERGAIAAGDRYAVLRARVAGLFEQGGRAWGYRTIHRMLRLDESDPIVVSEKVVRRIMREGGHAARVPEAAEAVELLRRRDRRGPGEPRGAGLPRRRAEHAVGHGRHPVHHGRVQVLAFPGGRLLRRDGGLLDLVALPERRHGEPDAP